MNSIRVVLFNENSSMICAISSCFFFDFGVLTFEQFEFQIVYYLLVCQIVKYLLVTLKIFG